MTETPDIEALAESFLDLWEEQLTAVSRGAEPYRALSLLVGLGTHGAPGGLDLWPFAAQGGPNGSRDGAAEFGGDLSGGGGEGERHGPGRTGASAADRTAAAGAPHGDRLDRFDELFARLDRIEERLAALEPGASKRS